MTRPSDGPTYLYRAYSRDGGLLYVGIATNWARRWAQHSERSAWFAAVSRLDIEIHPTRAAARDAERRICQDERPVHNIEHTERDTRPMRRISKAERYYVRSFDHLTHLRLPQYVTAAHAIDKLANALADDDSITQFDFEAILTDLARTVAYGDTCPRCNHDEPVLPIRGEVDGESIVCVYRCQCGHTWRCFWSVDAPLLWP